MPLGLVSQARKTPCHGVSLITVSRSHHFMLFLHKPLGGSFGQSGQSYTG